MEKRPNAPDRDLLCRWAGEMGMTQELILLCGGIRAARAPPMMPHRQDSCGIGAARASRRQKPRGRSTRAISARRAGARLVRLQLSGQGGFIKHNYTQDDYKRMVVNLDDEEDN